MHLIAALPGGWNPNDEGVINIDQSPGDVVFLSAADTELHTLSLAYAELTSDWLASRPGDSALPSLRCCSLLYFKKEWTVDTYVENVIEKAKLVVLRLIGGSGYYPHLFESVRLACLHHKIPVLFLPGYDAPDLELMNQSTVELPIVDSAWRYFKAGGKENLYHLLRFLYHRLLGMEWEYAPPSAHPDLFLYHPAYGVLTQERQDALIDSGRPTVALLAYRSHFLANNLEPFDGLSGQLHAKGFNVILAFAQTLREPRIHDDLHEMLTHKGRRKINVVVNTTSFSMNNLNEGQEGGFLFSRLDVPVIQAILASSTREVWKDGYSGLSPTDTAMNVVLPEVDGRIITRPISFKRHMGKDGLTDSDQVRYEAHEPGCRFVAEFSERWSRLQTLSNAEKRIALILPNYPNHDGRLANGVGLDTPASCVEILDAFGKAGYTLTGPIPGNSAELMNALTQGITNDLDFHEGRVGLNFLSREEFDKAYQAFSPGLREKIEKQWGRIEDSPHYRQKRFAIPGLSLGQVFIGIQPSRGYNLDPQAIYHSPDLPPTYAYLAFYFWMQDRFKADAVIHLGKHGNLEWLPGKSLALDPESCYPAALLGPLPHFYPFIVNDPGEGSQAKRRNQAIILDHLIPPLTRAETYGDLNRLENLIDEYYEAVNLDPKRCHLLKKTIVELADRNNLRSDLGVGGDDVDALLVSLDRYLCEIKEAQIRDGLHIFGKMPEGDQLIDLLIALHRVPTGNGPGLTQALAKDMNLAFDPLACDLGAAFQAEIGGVTCRTLGDAVEALEGIAKDHLQKNLAGSETPEDESGTFPRYSSQLRNIMDDTLPRLKDTEKEISRLLHGLNGGYIPSGPSGAPTRGRLDVLPTGRNFYSVDVRTVPTEAAYQLGSKSAALIIERHLQDKGEYPKSIGLSVWGTSTMRTGGDDLAQALALMGVKPVWQGPNRRVIDFEVIPLFLLKRPRVDVTLRISGFFRDAFPDSISLFHAAVKRVAELNEPSDQNPLRETFLREKGQWIAAGLQDDVSEEKALYRIFGSKPGAYGTGLQQVLDEKNWKTSGDLADIYIHWSGYAYGGNGEGKSAHESYRNRLGRMDAVMHNQDNREHDILDSDDYYQFQGGMANAAGMLRGEMPAAYFGDHSRPGNPKVKTLKEELLKVFRSRVINPKWMDGMKRHGYKGAFEMAATMDYLFAYGATTGLVEDFMYEGITAAYLMDPENRAFLRENNPWALKDMAERMLEAIQRGLWKAPKPETRQGLQELLLISEGGLEEKG
jgi:cobaltochelatase CobN